MKKLLLLLIVVLYGCTTTKYVYVNPKDSTNLIEIKKRIIYEDIYTPRINPFYNYYWNPYREPYYYYPRFQKQNYGPPPRSPRIGNTPIRRFNGEHR